MKLRLLLTALLIAFIASPFAHAGDEKDTPLEKQMGTMNRAFKQLKKQATESTLSDASLALVAQMLKAAQTSVDLIPEKAADLPEGDRAAFTAAYKEKMDKLIAVLGKLETALKAKDNAEAAKLVTELGAMQRSGHKEFRKPKD
ncbi:MAG: cytochrome b562 [Opitutaceae bacterium]|jgi:cytochrome c556